MVRLERQTFQNEVVELDGTHFVDCTFLNCIFEYRGGGVEFERPVMQGSCQVFYGRESQMDHPLDHSLEGMGVMPLDPFAWVEFPGTVN